jgi:hypothetical protein
VAWKTNAGMDVYSSGQRGLAVNQMPCATKVRILVHPQLPDAEAFAACLSLLVAGSWPVKFNVD